jgi:hypothetical protein
MKRDPCSLFDPLTEQQHARLFGCTHTGKSRTRDRRLSISVAQNGKVIVRHTDGRARLGATARRALEAL